MTPRAVTVYWPEVEQITAIHVSSRCVTDGSHIGTYTDAHCHVGGYDHGWICCKPEHMAPTHTDAATGYIIVTRPNLLLWHEAAHAIAATSDHGWRWRAVLRTLCPASLDEYVAKHLREQFTEGQVVAVADDARPVWTRGLQALVIGVPRGEGRGRIKLKMLTWPANKRHWPHDIGYFPPEMLTVTELTTVASS